MGFQLGNPIVYWVLRLIVLLSFFLSGYLISFKDKSGKSYWKYSSICIIIYSLVEGLRWNRGIDYPHYYQDLTGKLFQEYDDYVYLLWVDVFKYTGLPYWVAFIFYSFLFVFGFCLILKLFRKQAIWALPLFFIITISSSENLIRQFFAMAIAEFALYYFLKKKYIPAVIYSAIAFGIHSSVLMILGLIVLIYYIHFDKKIKTGWLLVAVYAAFYFFWDPSYLDPISDWMSKLSFGDEDSRANDYLSNADFWFSSESSLSDRLGTGGKLASIFSTTISFVTNCIIIKFGFDVTKIQPKYRIMYWLGFISVILFILSNNGDFEIWSRLSVMTRFLLPIVIAGILTELKMNNIAMYAIYGILGVYFLYNSFFSMWGQVGVMGCAFVWDK